MADPLPNDCSNSLAGDKLKAEIAKLNAETEKAVADAKFTNSRVHQWMAFAPATIAVSGIIAAYSSGWFDAKRSELAAEKKVLEYQSLRLVDSNAVMNATLVSAAENVRIAKLEAAAKQEEISKLNQEIAQRESVVRDLEDRSKSDNGKITSLVNLNDLLIKTNATLAAAEKRFRESAIMSSTDALQQRSRLFDVQRDYVSIWQILEEHRKICLQSNSIPIHRRSW